MVRKLTLYLALFLCLGVLAPVSLLGIRQLDTAALQKSSKFGASTAYAQGTRIVIEGADSVWDKSFIHSESLEAVANEVPARILAEYADSILTKDLQKPEQLSQQAASVSPRILVEYADSILSLDLERPLEIVPPITPPLSPPPTSGMEITLYPASGEVGTTVTVSGTGFGIRKEVIIYFNNIGVATTRTDTQGNFNITFNVLKLAAGIYNVDAKDEDDNIARAKFTIVAASSAPTPAVPPKPEQPTVEPTPVTPSPTSWWLEPQWLISIIIAGLACIVGIIRLVIVLRRGH